MQSCLIRDETRKRKAATHKTLFCERTVTSMHKCRLFNKVRFLTIKVSIAWRLSLSRCGTDAFRTAQERGAYGSRPYMQCPVFGGGGGGKWGNAPLHLPVPSSHPLPFPPLPRSGPWKPGSRYGECSKLLQWGPGRSRGRKRILVYFELENRTWWRGFFKHPKKERTVSARNVAECRAGAFRFNTSTMSRSL